MIQCSNSILGKVIFKKQLILFIPTWLVLRMVHMSTGIKIVFHFVAITCWCCILVNLEDTEKTHLDTHCRSMSLSTAICLFPNLDDAISACRYEKMLGTCDKS